MVIQTQTHQDLFGVTGATARSVDDLARGARGTGRQSGPVGPVLVAADGAPRAEAVFSAARLAADSLNTNIEVLTVCEPTPLAPSVGGGVLAAPELDALRQGQLLDDVRRSVAILASGDRGWPVTVQLGAPATVLADEAERRGASVLVMGIGRHNPLDRLFGTETTLATLRRVRVPVLAVGSSCPTVLRHAVVGMDFSPASVRAARLAMQLVAPTGQVTLVHIRPRFDHPSADWRAWDQEYGRSLTPLFADVLAQLRLEGGPAVDTMTVRGEPAPALQAVAQQVQADLLAVGTQRHGALERLLVGSVATRLLRNARIATLAAPSPLVAGPAGLAPEGVRVDASEDALAWPTMLDEFSRVNRGRAVILEGGPSAEDLRVIATRLRFAGASTDRSAGTVRLLLEQEGGETATHLAHEDLGVRRVAIVRDAAGHDLGLRLRHARGVTRLSLQ